MLIKGTEKPDELIASHQMDVKECVCGKGGLEILVSLKVRISSSVLKSLRVGVNKSQY